MGVNACCIEIESRRIKCLHLAPPHTHMTLGFQNKLAKALNIRHNKNIILYQTIRRHFYQLSLAQYDLKTKWKTFLKGNK